MSVPSWIRELKAGDELLVNFLFTGKTVFANIYSTRWDGLYITYDWNNAEKMDFLAWDEYGQDGSKFEHWTAYQTK